MPRATPERRGPSARAAERAQPTPTGTPNWVRTVRRWRLVVWAGATVVVLALAAAAIEHKVTWYLAVDQFGYLLFARDLLHGRIFHEWPVANVLAGLLPERTDVLAQTYVWDHGLLYSRYAPGFPIILAAWVWLFGEAAAHLLNP